MLKLFVFKQPVTTESRKETATVSQYNMVPSSSVARFNTQ
jgi:hypothetical protein